MFSGMAVVTLVLVLPFSPRRMKSFHVQIGLEKGLLNMSCLCYSG